MLSSNVPAFLKMLLIAAVMEKRQVPASVRLPTVGGGGLIYACRLPSDFLKKSPAPRHDAPRSTWREFAYQMAACVKFELEDVHSRGLQS